jgi:S-ribosylhomocysteine lyase
MVDIEQLGWNPNSVGEVDHRSMKAPHVKLRSATTGEKGDVVYCVDLRTSRPNTDYLSMTELHSLEHFLLAGFRKYMPKNFLSIGIMGCQTGFYLVLLNEGHAHKICNVYKSILTDILAATEVPYAKIQECGNFRNHDLKLAQNIAKKLLAAESNWLQVV